MRLFGRPPPPPPSCACPPTAPDPRENARCEVFKRTQELANCTTARARFYAAINAADEAGVPRSAIHRAVRFASGGPGSRPLLLPGALAKGLSEFRSKRGLPRRRVHRRVDVTEIRERYYRR